RGGPAPARGARGDRAGAARARRRARPGLERRAQRREERARADLPGATRRAASLSDLAGALVWHTHPFQDLLALVRPAQALGYRAAYVDGDVSMIDSRGDGDVLDGWTTTVALLVSTTRIEIGSIRLVHHWNPARLAQAVATVERIAPGRLRFLV